MKRSMLVLCSGGLDSVTTAHLAQDAGYEVLLLHVIYGQRHVVETYCARECAMRLNVPYYAVHIPLWTSRDTAMVDKNKPIEHHGYKSEHMSTYVPARNTVFVAVAMSYMETLKIPMLGLGVHAAESYPDTSVAWARAIQLLMLVGMELSVFDHQNVSLYTPFIARTKGDVVRAAIEHNVPIERTWSCYDPLEERCTCTRTRTTTWHPCGVCATCLDRNQAIREAGLDPAALQPCIMATDKEMKTITGDITFG